jgi:hypothetical protein
LAHKAFWTLETRAKAYETYMKEHKNWKKWPENVDLEEIRRLLEFIPKWDFHFKMKNPSAFFAVYKEILPTITELKNERLEDSDLNTNMITEISEIFDRIAPCSGEAYESTDCSKILHTILPHLIVMWDRKIRQGILGDENKNRGAVYALEFLPQMQIELREAITTCMNEKALRREEAIRHIYERCGYESLPKLIDEHNYAIYTMSDDFKRFLEDLLSANQISLKEYQRLLKKVP